jgi:DUF4097 and DUF4098 domain-containing protein YvlB
VIPRAEHADNGRIARAGLISGGLISGTVLLALSAFLAGPAMAKDVDETHPAAANGTVDIENVAGAVTVTGWDKSEVSVTGTLCDDCTLEFDRDGERTVVHVNYPEGRSRRFGDEGESNLTVKVPEGSTVSASTVSANLDASGVKGDVIAESVSGKITVRGEPRRVEAQAVSGGIDILAATPRVKAESVSGDILLQGPKDELESSNVSGATRVQGGPFSSVEASAVSGDIVFDADLKSDARCEISSHSGDVEMRVAPDASADFSVETFSGEIHNDFGGKAERASKYAPGEELNFTLGSGSAQVELNSFSGRVRIVRK